MKIQIAESRKVEHPLGNDAAVADHDDRVWFTSSEFRAKFVVGFNFFWLRDGNAEAQRGLFDRRERHFHATSMSTIRLRDHQRYGITCRDKLFQGRNSKGRSAAKDQCHR